jgi:energy-coupling factor transporter ATP-binding protein EcfA2
LENRSELILVEDIKKAFDSAERIGVIGSPSSTGQLTIDILGTAVNKSLVGSLSVFGFSQDGYDHYALGQIVEIVMQNVWSQDPTIRGLIRQKGRIDPITERQDTHVAKMTVSSVFARKSKAIEQSFLGTVPSTGTAIKILNEEIMSSLLTDYAKQLFYLGMAYGTNVKMPMWFKHFGWGDSGAGEAYHIGIFGKTGSGKSVLAKMIMTAYAKHKAMSIFILDPQGEFSRDLREESALKNVLQEKLSRTVQIYDLHNLVLTGDELFKRILINSKFFERLGIYHEDNKLRAADEIESILKARTKGGQTQLEQKIPPYKAYTRGAFDRIWNALGTDEVLRRIYTTTDPRERVRTTIQTADPEEYYQMWVRITNLFKYEGKTDAIEIKKLVKKIHDKKEKASDISIIDLSERNIPEDILWDDMMKLVVIGEFLERITQEAEWVFKKNELLNSLVIIDEAHRLAPREKTENEDLEKVKETLVDAVRTTRKFGLGWMFISQTLSSLSREILDQIRIYIFGFGLGWGIERLALQDIIGGQKEAMKLYQLFRDPQSSLTKKEYPFMTVGPVSPLSFSGTPLFFNALKYPEDFISANFGAGYGNQ